MGTSVKRKARISPDWFGVSAEQTIGALGEVTFDMSGIIKVISDAQKQGKTVYAHAIAIQVNHSGTYAASGAGNAARSADIQRGCFYTVNFQQGNIKNSWFSKIPRLSFARQVGLMVNPSAVTLDRLINSKRRMFNSLSTPDTNTASATITPSPDVDVRPNLSVGWRDDENWQSISTVLAGAFDFNDVFTVPMCKATTGGFYNDKLPAMMIADPSNPWKVIVQEVTAGGSSIRTDHFKTTAHTVKVRVLVYLSFVDDTSDLSVGVQWTCNPFSFNNNNPLPAHYHVAIVRAPNYDSTQKDGALAQAVPYVPANFQTVITDDDIRIFDCNEQVFPLTTESLCERQVMCWNLGAALGEHPAMLYNEEASSTVYVGTSSIIAGTEVASWLGNDGIGEMSSAPFFPFLVNNYLTKGFIPNIMAKPGCQVDHRIEVTGSAALPAGGGDFDIYAAEYDSDRIEAMSYAMFGKGGQAVPAGAWKPLVSNPSSPVADEAVDIVPWVLTRG